MPHRPKTRRTGRSLVKIDKTDSPVLNVQAPRIEFRRPEMTYKTKIITGIGTVLALSWVGVLSYLGVVQNDEDRG
jgi:hypothetical protein